MSNDANKVLVGRFLESFSAGRVAEALALMADDAQSWVSGDPLLFPLAGTRSKAQFAELLGMLGSVFPKGLRVTPKAFTAEGERVAVEAESDGVTAAGKIYRNQYHFLFEVRDGRICSVREYFDTLSARETLSG
jgi:ketosteroid isomerase-like protein